MPDAGIGARWLGYVSLFLLVGAVVFRLLALRTVAPSPLQGDLVRRARGVALVAAIAFLLEIALKLYLQVRAFSDPGAPVTWAAAEPIITSTTWGTGWSWQFGLGVMALLGVLLARSTRVGWWMAGLAAVGGIVAGPLTGHATEHPWGITAGVALHALHSLGGAVWLGTLAALISCAYPALRGRDDRDAQLAALVHRYSPLALAGAGSAIGLGVLLALLAYAPLGALFSTTYGLVLVLKVALLGGAVALGWYNWQRVRPALGAAEGSARLARSATLELLIGTVVLAVTAILVALPAPGLE